MYEGIDNILLLSTRRAIYQFISKSPGFHLREISRRLHIPLTTVKYHLHVLTKRELIKEKKEGRYLRYYAINTVGSHDKKLISLLRLDIPRIIILYLLIHYWSTQVDISNSFHKHPTTIEYYLKKLMDVGLIEQVKPVDGKIYRDENPRIIECETVGREKVYIIKNPQQIYDIIITYKQSIIDDTISKDLFVWISFLQTTGHPKKVIAPKKWEKSLDDVFWEVFPHPYHV